MTGASAPCACGTAADAAARGLLAECPRHGLGEEEMLLALADVCAERRFEIFGELVRTTRSGGLAIRGRGADGKLWRSGTLHAGELFERQLAIRMWSENEDGQMGTEGEQHEREIGRWRVDGRGQGRAREGELGLEVARVRARGVVVR